MDEHLSIDVSVDKDYNLWHLLHQTKDAIGNMRQRELSQYGITNMEAGALFFIQTLGGQATPAEISRWIFRKHHTVTALLNRMEKKGLITKTKNSGKKNSWRVSLTEKGHKAFSQSTKRESIHMAISPLSKDERERLGSYLKKVRDHALKHSVIEPTIPFP